MLKTIKKEEGEKSNKKESRVKLHKNKKLYTFTLHFILKVHLCESPSCFQENYFLHPSPLVASICEFLFFKRHFSVQLQAVVNGNDVSNVGVLTHGGGLVCDTLAHS